MGDVKFGIVPVALKLTENVPQKPHGHKKDIVQFINASGMEKVTLYFPRSPFVAGNGDETFDVYTTLNKQVDANTPVGSYPSQKTFTQPVPVGGPPDGPTIVIDG